MIFNRYATVLIASLALVSCVSNDDDNSGFGNGGGAGSGDDGGAGGGGDTGPLTGCAALDTLSIDALDPQIIDLDPATLSPIVTDVFNRYTAITTPSGGRIHVLAQAGVSDARIRRAREVLNQHLENLPGTIAGADKADVANSISGNCGTLAMFNDMAALDLTDPAVATFDADFGSAYVPLFGDAVIIEGSPEYIQESPAYDQTFGATAVLVYRQGLVQERPDWSNQLILAATNAEADGSFNPTGPEPYQDLNEVFLGVVMESHAGVWGHDPSGDGSANNGLYAFGERPTIGFGDASTLALIEDFFAQQHTFPAEVDPGFMGEFDLLFRENMGFTNRSQYLGEVRLTGNNSTNLFGTSQNDILVGNDGNNNLNGRSGDDSLDGGEGLDTAVFGAPFAEFTITDNGDGSMTIQHNEPSGLGTDVIRNFEVLVFSDMVINI